MITEILNGDIYIPELNDSKDSIGQMEYTCHYCAAIKFKKETSSLCCMDGKVILEHFPEPPEELNNLWLDKVPETEVFLKHARVLNNAVCLSSVAVHEKIMPKYNPSVIFHGRLNQYLGLLKAQDGVMPHFAHLVCRF